MIFFCFVHTSLNIILCLLMCRTKKRTLQHKRPLLRHDTRESLLSSQDTCKLYSSFEYYDHAEDDKRGRI